MDSGRERFERLVSFREPPVGDSLETRLRWLQRVLPAGIFLLVLVYEVLSEVVLGGPMAGWVRVSFEILLFGLFGATVIWNTLSGIRHHLQEEANRNKEALTKDRILSAITANSADAIILLNNDGLIQSWNRGAELIFGYRPEEVLGKHFGLLVPESLRVRGELDYINNELTRQGFLRGYVTQRVTKDGRTIAVEVTRTWLRDEEGRVVGSSAILRDVTDRERAQAEIRELNRHLEAQVRQRTHELLETNRELQRRHRELELANSELQQLDRLKSEFVSLVSHELRAPLANISGSLQLVLEDENTPLAENQREMLILANEQVERLGRLVKGILNVSRIEAGQMDFQPQAFDILHLIDRVLGQFATSNPTHQFSGPTTPNLPSVWGDRDRVEEVLTNLLDNATKYSEDGTPIRVEAQVVDSQLVVAVTDQGQGIPPEELSKIFAKFHRVERDDARDTYGHGLGLYISSKLIEAMSGQMWVESEVDRGSTFSFSLPLAGRAHAAARPAAHLKLDAPAGG